MKRAEIETFRLHDLRHSAASYLSMNGASLLEIARILGHITLQVVKRYSHLSEDHKATVLEKMNGKIFVNAGVDEIITKKGKAIGVRLENGDEVMAPLVISSAGVMNTFGRFLKSDPQFGVFKKKLQKVTPTFSYHSLYIGLDKTAEALSIKIAWEGEEERMVGIDKKTNNIIIRYIIKMFY